jgi:heat shock protein HslJ
MGAGHPLFVRAESSGTFQNAGRPKDMDTLMEMKMKKMMMLFVLAALALAACSPGAVSTPSLEGGWSLVSFGPAASQTPAVPDVETSIEFKGGQMSGNVGCNGFGGEYSVDGDTITFGPVVSTMMYCEAVAEQESGALAVFQETAGFVLDGDTLTIISADGAMSIVLERK